MSKNGFPKIVLKKNFKKMTLQQNGLVCKKNNLWFVTETFFFDLEKILAFFIF